MSEDLRTNANDLCKVLSKLTTESATESITLTLGEYMHSTHIFEESHLGIKRHFPFYHPLSERQRALGTSAIDAIDIVYIALFEKDAGKQRFNLKDSKDMLSKAMHGAFALYHLFSQAKIHDEHLEHYEHQLKLHNKAK